MACHWQKLKFNGVETWVHLNIAAPRRRKCAYCDCPDAKALCDYPTAEGKTCDKPICYRHRRHVGPDVDYCLAHDLAKPVPAQERLF